MSFGSFLGQVWRLCPSRPENGKVSLDCTGVCGLHFGLSKERLILLFFVQDLRAAARTMFPGALAWLLSVAWLAWLGCLVTGLGLA